MCRIATGEMGRKMVVVVDAKAKEIRASFCSLLIEKLKIVYEVGEGKNFKKSLKL